MNEITFDGAQEIGHDLIKLFLQAPSPIAVLKGRELRHVFANDAYLKLFNYRDILGKPAREAFPELEGQPFFDLLENVIESGNPFFGNEMPARIYNNGDSSFVTRYYNITYTPFHNDIGITEGVMAFGYDVTDQVEARQKEHESAIRFRNIVEQSTDPILILKGEELVLDVANDALLRLWNKNSDCIGKPFLEILPEMKDQGFHELLLDVLHNGTTHYGYETEVYFKRDNGEKEKHYFNFIYQPYREENGKPSGVLVLATDITEQIKTKQKLTQSEINFKNMVEQAPVAMCVLKGPDFIVTIANQKIYELWGKTEKELSGKPIFEGLQEVKGQGLETLLEEVYTTGKPFIASERPVQLPRNGKLETRYINFVYEAFREDTGKITGIIAVAHDVTEQVLARHKIELAQESARLAIESADQGTYEINLVTNDMFTSPRFKVIWGVEHETTDRSVYAAAIHKDDLAARAEAHKESLLTGNLQYEARVMHKDGNYRWVKIKGKILFDAEGKAERILGVIQDVTEQKIFSEELSKKVDERTKALQETNKRLEESNEELEQFAHVASHDLQEPLRKIQLFNNMLQEATDMPDTAKKYIEKISKSASRMSGLIKDLLEYSRLSNKSHFEKTDLNLVLQNVLTDYEILIAQKEVKINTSILPVIEAIPLQMNQLLFNLIGNALKFTRRNIQPEITVSANKLSEERKNKFEQLRKNLDYYVLTICDNGIGFSQSYADKIFTIFQQLNDKSIYGGYGIGLALCRKIVTTHSGVIYAEGKVKEGAKFHIIIPCTQS